MQVKSAVPPPPASVQTALMMSWMEGAGFGGGGVAVARGFHAAAVFKNLKRKKEKDDKTLHCPVGSQRRSSLRRTQTII